MRNWLRRLFCRPTALRKCYHLFRIDDYEAQVVSCCKCGRPVTLNHLYLSGQFNDDQVEHS